MNLSQTGRIVAHHILMSAQFLTKEVEHCERRVVGLSVCVAIASELHTSPLGCLVVF